MTVTGLILAAGASVRMGRPKALLRYRGESFLDRMIGLLSACSDEVIVVLGEQADGIRASLERAGMARFVVNPDPARGQLSSLRTGLAAIAGGAVIFSPLDYPAVLSSTAGAVAAALREGASLVVPRYQNRHGHPVGISAALAGEIMALAGDASARDVIHRHAARYLDTGDPGILLDVDSPADYRRLVQEGSLEEE